MGGADAQTASSGETIRVDTDTADVEVQWQVQQGGDGPWMPIAGQTGKSLTLTDDHAGDSVRAKVTYMGDDDNPSHVTWVEYSVEATVAALTTADNNTPERQQATYELRVNPDVDDDGVAGTATGNVAGLFFDADRDDLTYTLVGDSVDDGQPGIQPGNTVFRTAMDDQILTVNKDCLLYTSPSPRDS